MKNYLERLRFAIDFRTKKYAQITLKHQDTVQTYQLDEGVSTCVFDTTVYDTGENTLELHIQSGEIKILDLRIHGVSVGLGIYRCDYVTAEHESKGTVLNLGEQGVWRYQFDTPVHESNHWKIGLV